MNSIWPLYDPGSTSPSSGVIYRVFQKKHPIFISRSYLLFLSNKTFLGRNWSSVCGYLLIQHWIWENSDVSADSQQNNNLPYFMNVTFFGLHKKLKNRELYFNSWLLPKMFLKLFLVLKLSSFFVNNPKLRFYVKN